MMEKEKEMQKKFAEEAKDANPVPVTDERLSMSLTRGSWINRMYSRFLDI